MSVASNIPSISRNESRTAPRLRPAPSPARIRIMRSATSSWRSSAKTIRAGRWRAR
jgi:hypothetical protein